MPNAIPSLFSVFFNLVKPLLNGTTLQKVSVYGKDQWKEALLKHIDPDQLPKHWGGNCVDEKTGDPRCNSHPRRCVRCAAMERASPVAFFGTTPHESQWEPRSVMTHASQREHNLSEIGFTWKRGF
ncbi:putative retinal-binding protein [Ixodes scapularis]